MGKSSGIHSWLSAFVKKAFRSPMRRKSRRRRESEQEEEEKMKRGKWRWIFRKPFLVETTPQHIVATESSTNNPSSENMLEKHHRPKAVEMCSASHDDDHHRHSRRALAVAMAKISAAEAAVVKALAATDTIRLSSNDSQILITQHNAAVIIQTIFRGFLARKALLALKGVVKMQALIRGDNVRIRAKMTLQCMQSLVRVQAQVCEQRRRRSCEGSMFSHSTLKPNGMTTKDFLNETCDSPITLKETEALVQQAREISPQQRKISLGQTWAAVDDDQIPDIDRKRLEYVHQWARKDKSFCNDTRNPIKTVEIDTYRPHFPSSPNSHKLYDQHKSCYNLFLPSPKAPCSSKIKSIKTHPSNPCYQAEERKFRVPETPILLRSNYSHRTSMSEKSCPFPQLSYMAATASTVARERSFSAPRQRPMSPHRAQMRSAKKRLLFPSTNGHVNDCKGYNFRHRISYDSQYGF